MKQSDEAVCVPAAEPSFSPLLSHFKRGRGVMDGSQRSWG